MTTAPIELHSPPLLTKAQKIYFPESKNFGAGEFFHTNGGIFTLISTSFYELLPAERSVLQIDKYSVSYVEATDETTEGEVKQVLGNKRVSPQCLHTIYQIVEGYRANGCVGEMHLPPKEHLKIFFVPSLEVTLRLSPYGKGFMLLADPFKEDAYIPKGAQVFYSDVMIRSVR